MNLNIVMEQPQRLVPHPYNRDFPTSGDEWEQFVESIRFRGVMSPIMVRKMGHDWQIVAGHRRTKAAMVAGLLEVPIQVEELSDKEAMEIVFVDNLLAVGLSTYDEALGVKGLLETGYTPEKLAQRCCKDIRWVKTRQAIFDLGDEVVEAVKKPKEDPGHLPVRSLEEIIKVPEELRAEAIQIVLFPDFQPAVLSPMQAKDVLEERLVKPHAARIEWEKTRDKLVKEWKKRLGPKCLKGTRKELLVTSVPWESCEATAKGGVPAERPVPMGEHSADAPQFMCWLHLAVRHGMPVRIVHDPAGGQDKSLALVDVKVLQEAEESRAAINALGKPIDPEFKPWLITRARGAISRETAAGSAREDEGPTFADLEKTTGEAMGFSEVLKPGQRKADPPVGAKVTWLNGKGLKNTARVITRERYCQEWKVISTDTKGNRIETQRTWEPSDDGKIPVRMLESEDREELAYGAEFRLVDVERLECETEDEGMVEEVPAFLRKKNDPATAGDGGNRDAPDPDAKRVGECDRCQSDSELDACPGCGRHVCLSCATNEGLPEGESWKCSDCANGEVCPGCLRFGCRGHEFAVVNLLPVRELRARAAELFEKIQFTGVSGERVPRWVSGEYPDHVMEICDWFLDLIRDKPIEIVPAGEGEHAGEEVHGA